MFPDLYLYKSFKIMTTVYFKKILLTILFVGLKVLTKYEKEMLCFLYGHTYFTVLLQMHRT